MIQAMSGGVRAAPSELPLMAKPKARPRSCGATQFATTRLPVGGAMASPMPITPRTTINEPTTPSSVVSGNANIDPIADHEHVRAEDQRHDQPPGAGGGFGSVRHGQARSDAPGTNAV